MKSPFPGMDPYLEAHWGDVHTSLITYARDVMQGQMPDDLKVRVEEHVAIESMEGNGDYGFYPDIRVVEYPHPFAQPGLAEAGIAVAEPLLVDFQFEPETQRSIQIVDTRSGNSIVTVIEILSTSNKTSAAGRKAYRRKQRELLQGEVNLVEIDLLREGGYIMTVPEDILPREYQAPYRICVSRQQRRKRGEVYRASLREKLPTFRIPLREGDEDVTLDLQKIVDLAYENGGYGDTDYRLDPIPPLYNEDAEWADKLLREKGRR